MAVMNASRGKMLNHRQLKRNPKYKIKWNKSVANEFVRLANGVSNRVERTKTIEFIRKFDVPQSRRKDVTSLLFATSKMKNQKRIEPGL